MLRSSSISSGHLCRFSFGFGCGCCGGSWNIIFLFGGGGFCSLCLLLFRCFSDNLSFFLFRCFSSGSWFIFLYSRLFSLGSNGGWGLYLCFFDFSFFNLWWLFFLNFLYLSLLCLLFR